MATTLRRIRTGRLAAVALFIAAADARPGAADNTIDVLWYTYAHPQSEYRTAGIAALASTAHRHPEGSGVAWKLTFFDPHSPTPDFAAYDVLVIHSGERFRSGPPGGPLATPDYTGILGNKAAIAAARGERTIISGTDADFHAIRGDTGRCPPGAGCGHWDGARGYLINMVNWAASGRGLGIVALLDGEFPPLDQRWWTRPDSFLHDDLAGRVSYFRDNAPVIPVRATRYPLNGGLTTRGLADWTISMHGGFADAIGYTGTVFSSRKPDVPVTIATTAYVGAATVPAPEPSLAARVGAGIGSLAAFVLAVAHALRGLRRAQDGVERAR